MDALPETPWQELDRELGKLRAAIIAAIASSPVGRVMRWLLGVTS